MAKSFFVCDNPSIELTKSILLSCNKFIQLYKQLIDSYVLDFYACNHWNSLPTSWKSYFTNILPNDLPTLVDMKKDALNSRFNIMPLELMCVRILIRYLSIPRDLTDVKCSSTLNNLQPDNFDSKLSEDNRIEKIFWKHVKIKKKHEIKLFAKITYEAAKKTNCWFVVDVGSGLGHLVRLLAYSYKLNVCGIECKNTLTLQAREMDITFEKQVKAYDKDFLVSKNPPVHLNYTVMSEIDSEDFLKMIRNAFRANGNLSFGIVGLHPCGNLGPTLLKLYKRCPNIRFINIVGCCYMKLSTIENGDLTPTAPPGYPISKFCLKNHFQLSYNAREIACHAIESYLERLRSGNDWQLKIHSYRAAIEYLIIQEYPYLKHSPLANVKYKPNMTFKEYCIIALKKLNVSLSEENVNSSLVKDYLNNWKSVVIFYSIRLIFAPVIESIILLDRYLYLLETKEDESCCLMPVFDPLVSARNHILLGMRRSCE